MVHRQTRGFALLELLLVLVVIAALVGGYFKSSGSGPPEQGTYNMSMDRSRGAACIAGRSALRTNIEMFRMNNPRAAINNENLEKAGVTVPKCPEGGAYGFTGEGMIICSKHPDK